MSATPVFQENFDDGTKGNFDGTTVDGGTTALFFRHWKALATASDRPMPFRGAYVPEINLAAVDSSGTYFLENTAFDHTTDVTRSLRFYMWFSTDLVMAASDTFDIFVLRSASVNEVTVSVKNNSGVIEIGAGETAGTTRATKLTLGAWHPVELTMAIDGAANGSGLIDFFIDGDQVGAQIGSLTQAATTNARFGVQAIDAGTTTGRIYFDHIMYDESRVYPFAEHKPFTVEVTDSEHIFVGPGELSAATLRSTGAANTMHIYDTDTANTNDPSSRKVELDLNTHTSFDGPLFFEKGCYVALAGTNPRGEVVVARRPVLSRKPYIYQSDAAMRNGFARGLVR